MCYFINTFSQWNFSFGEKNFYLQPYVFLSCKTKVKSLSFALLIKTDFFHFFPRDEQKSRNKTTLWACIPL